MDHDVIKIIPQRGNEEWENETTTQQEAFYDVVHIGKWFRFYVDIKWVALGE